MFVFLFSSHLHKSYHKTTRNARGKIPAGLKIRALEIGHRSYFMNIPHYVYRLYLSMKGYKIKFVTHRLPHCRLLSQKCSLEGDLYSRKCMIVFLTYFHLRMTHYKMTIQSMLKALKIQFL